MAEAAKWALLAAAVAVAIAAIMGLGLQNYIDVSELSSALSSVVSIAGSGIAFGRGMVNNLLSPFGRTLFTGLLAYLCTKWVVTLVIRISSWVYHFVFK